MVSNNLKTENGCPVKSLKSHVDVKKRTKRKFHVAPPAPNKFHVVTFSGRPFLVDVEGRIERTNQFWFLQPYDHREKKRDSCRANRKMLFNKSIVWMLCLIVWLALQSNSDVSALHSSHHNQSLGLSRRISRATASLDASTDHLKTVARVATAVYLTRELINGTDKGDEITSELLKMGSAKPSKITGIDATKLRSAVTELKNLPTALNTKPASLKTFVDNMNAAIVIKENMVNITKINSWPERASFKATLQSLQTSGVDHTVLRQVKSDLDDFKDSFTKAKTDASKKADLIQYSDSLIASLPQLTSSVQFSTSGTAMDGFSRINKLINTVASFNKIDDSRTPQHTDVKDILDKLFNVAKKFSDASADLLAVAEVVHTRSRPGSLRQLTYTAGWTEGHADLTRVPNDVHSPWMKDIINSSSFEKSVGVLKQLSTSLTTSNGKFGTFDEQKDSVVTSLKAASDKFTLIASKRAPFETAVSAIISSITLPRSSENDAVVVQLKVKELDALFAQYEVSIEKAMKDTKDKDLVKKLQDMVAELKKPANNGKTLSEIFDPIDPQIALAADLKSVSTSLSDDAITNKATEVVNALPDVDTFLTKQDPHFSELDNIAKINDLDLVKDVHDLIMSADSTANPNRPDYSEALPIVDSVKVAAGSLASVLTAVGAVKGVNSMESDGLKLLEKPKVVSDHIGNAVRCIGEMKKAIDAIPKMQAVISSSTLVRTGRLAASNLNSGDITQLKALESLNNTLAPLILQLNGFKTTVAASTLKKLTDSGAIFTAAKTVSGTTTNLAPMLLALDHLIAFSPNQNTLQSTRAGLATLRNIDLDFASSHVHFDSAKQSMVNLEKFFASFARNMDAAAIKPSPENSKGRNEDKSGARYSQADTGKSGEEKEEEGEDYIVWIGVCVGVGLLLFIAGGVVFCMWKKQQAAEKKAEKAHVRIVQLEKELNDFKDQLADSKEKLTIAEAERTKNETNFENARKKSADLQMAVTAAEQKVEEANKRAEEANQKAQSNDKDAQRVAAAAVAQANEANKELEAARNKLADQTKETRMEFEKAEVARKQAAELEKRAATADKAVQDLELCIKNNVPKVDLDRTQPIVRVIVVIDLGKISGFSKFYHSFLKTLSKEQKVKKSLSESMANHQLSIIVSYNASDMALNPNPPFDKRNYRHTRRLVEETRVKDVNGETADNCVHANLLQIGSVSQFSMIAMQAPQDAAKDKADTNWRLWNVVDQQSVSQIVMLCNFVEEGKVKSSQYFPLEVNETKEFNGIRITCLTKTAVQNGDIIVRDFSALYPAGHTANCTHYHVQNWTDHGTPKDVQSVVWLMKQLRESTMTVLVHCSAGEGRTGCIAMIENALQMIAAGRYDLNEWMSVVRRQRSGAVENNEQFSFCILVALTIAIDGREFPENEKKSVGQIMKGLEEVIEQAKAKKAAEKAAEAAEAAKKGKAKKANMTIDETEQGGGKKASRTTKVSKVSKASKTPKADRTIDEGEQEAVKKEKKPKTKKPKAKNPDVSVDEGEVL